MAKNKQTRVVVQPRKKSAKQKKELTRLGAALRSLGGLGGGAVGSLIGMPTAGAATGSSLGAALSRWLGSGDYEVSQNSLVSSLKASGSIPAMHKDGQTVTIRHREFLCEVRGTTTFQVQQVLPINPGMDKTFPWLANIAQQFQQYRIRGMVFHYIPTSGNAVSSTNNALGSVMLQTSYRASDIAPATKVELLNEYWSTEVVPSETVAHPIECNPSENPFNVQYVRGTDTIPTGDSVLMYDLGRTYLATSGQQTSGVILGDLWVTYEIELKKPVLYNNVLPTEYFSARFAGPINNTSYFSAPGIREGSLPVTFNTFRLITFGEDMQGTYDVWFTVFSTAGVATPASGPTGDPTLSGEIVMASSGIAAGTTRVETIVNVAGSTVNRLTYGFSVTKNRGGPATIELPTMTTGSGTWANANVNVYQCGDRL
nr:structural protein [Tolivirales sp.]